MASSSLTASSLEGIPVSFASCSLSNDSSQTLPMRIRALHKAGFTGMELSMPDLVDHATKFLDQKVAEDDYTKLCTAAEDVKKLCDSLGIEIMLLQPFANFEGWEPHSPESTAAYARARGWISIMAACGCKTLQVGSTDTPASKLVNKDGIVSREAVIRDLQALADMLAASGFRMAYENWCWSTHAPDWKDVWDIVRRVERDNVGLCLDTFQTAGGEWADPSTESGKLAAADAEQRFQHSLERLAKEVPADKIYMLQISDAYKLDKPITTEDEDGLRPRGRWSHDYRPLPYKGYLPVVDVAKAVLKTGFRGWFSYEVFDFPPWKEGRVDLEAYAQEAHDCQRRLIADCVDK